MFIIIKNNFNTVYINRYYFGTYIMNTWLISMTSKLSKNKQITLLKTILLIVGTCTFKIQIVNYKNCFKLSWIGIILFIIKFLYVEYLKQLISKLVCKIYNIYI